MSDRGRVLVTCIDAGEVEVVLREATRLPCEAEVLRESATRRLSQVARA